MWEAAFTYGGGMDDPSPHDAEEGADPTAPTQGQAAEWYLLNLKFLFRVRDARGGECFRFFGVADRERRADALARTVWSPTPTGPMKEHIIDLCNRELARRKPPAADGEASTSAPKTAERDAPLVRGYNFLRSSLPCSLPYTTPH
jgi:hypothetical protein